MAFFYFSGRGSDFSHGFFLGMAAEHEGGEIDPERVY
jgi:hypothetical protein